MEIQNRDQIVSLISRKIKENGPVKLPVLHSYLVENGIAATGFTGGLKKWLIANFPEFYLFGNNGRETLELAQSPLAEFYRLLLNRFPIVPPVTSIGIHAVKELIRQAGLNPAEYDTPQAITNLLKPYPDYQLTEAAAPEIVHELPYIHSVAFLNWKQVISSVKRLSGSEIGDAETLRIGIARRFAQELLDGDGLLLDTQNEKEPRIALSTGFQTENGKTVYCILQPNSKDASKQAWMLAGTVFPGEDDEEGLGRWLDERFFSGSGIPYKALQTQLEDILVQRRKLQELLPAFLETLNAGTVPGSVSGEVARYEQQWQELSVTVEQLPMRSAESGMSLDELSALLNEKNMVTDLTQRAVLLFDELYSAVMDRLAILHASAQEADCVTIHGLFASENIAADIEKFREVLVPYNCLKEVLFAKDRSEVRDSVFVVSDHFGLDKLDVLGFLMSTGSRRSQKYAFLDYIPEIEQILEQCRLAHSEEEKTDIAAIDADALAEMILAKDSSIALHWVDLYSKLMPREDQLRSAILGAGNFGSYEERLTPSGAAGRLLNTVGNQDRLAEKYLLLGLVTDRQACAPMLLSLYRKNADEAHFMKLWESDAARDNASEEDALYWLSICCRLPEMDWNEVERFVAKNAGLKKSPKFRQIMESAACTRAYPAACRRWMGLDAVSFNQLELATVSNHTDEIYQLLEDPKQMADMGYDPNEISGIRQALAAGLPGGTDPYGKAVRLYRIQKNKNSAAESQLWEGQLSQMSLRMLCDIYGEAEDYRSLCWLIRTFSVPLDTMKLAEGYADALSKTEQYDVLKDLLTAHPELWHRSALLEGLDDPFWMEIRQREEAFPVPAEATDFEQAIIDDDTKAMDGLLSDAEQMASWGYTPEMLSELRERLDAGKAASGTEPVAVIKRFKYYQGNFHRCMERYLYRQFDGNTNWTVQHLYSLTFSEGRFAETARYFELYPMLAKVSSNITKYLWCLLRTGKDEQLFHHAELHPECLRGDSSLTNEIAALAEQKGMQEYAANILRIITLLPRNAFESAVMTGNHAELQKYVSNPDLLTDLGYSADNISRFKDRIGKPMPSGSEGYYRAFRMRLFFGNERAIPFLQDAIEDDRSVKLLLDIFFSMERWEDVCRLYRENLSRGIWNATFEMRYTEALPQSHAPEDCRLYLEYLEGDRNPDKESVQYRWKYLRCLIGIGAEDAAMQQMRALGAAEEDCPWNLVTDALTMAWDTGSDSLRESAVLLAGKLLLAQMNTMTLEQQKQLMSVNGRLLQEEPRKWIELLDGSGMEQVTMLLMCYFGYGIEAGAQNVEAAAQKLLDLMNDVDVGQKSNVLTAVTKFVTDSGLLAEDNSEWGRRLFAEWKELALTRSADSGLLRLEELSDAEYQMFREFWSTVSLTEEQISAVHAMCFCDLGTRTQWNALFFQRILGVLAKTMDSKDFEQYADRLMDEFIRWFAAVTEDSDSIRIAAQFIREIRVTYRQMKEFVEQTSGCPALYDSRIHNVVLSKCELIWPDIVYDYLKAEYGEVEQEERRQEVLSRAMLLTHTEAFRNNTDDDSLDFDYRVVSMDPSPENLYLLGELYREAGKQDYADILKGLETVNGIDADTAALRSWFRQTLEERSVEWLERYSGWWAPLVVLREEDKQTKSILSFLSNDDESMQHSDSVLRLLLSELHNSTYIGCYLRLETELSQTADAKLVYIRALYDEKTCVDAIKKCIVDGQYVYAVKLLTTGVNLAYANYVFVGQTIGEIYTEERVKRFPELSTYLSGIFDLIIRLNQQDPEGAWKNMGRAVDVAILTGNEPMFFDVFNRNQNMYVDYPGKCAALVASLILRREFETAEYYIREHQQRKGNDPNLYMTLLEFVVQTCLRTGELSEENEILVRSVPVNGNIRPLELYGALTHYAVEKRWLKSCARAFYTLRGYAKQDIALLNSCLQLYCAVMEEYSLAELYDVAANCMLLAGESYKVMYGKVLAAISACVPDQISSSRFLTDCTDYGCTTEIQSELAKFYDSCTKFLREPNDRKDRVEFLLRAVTGWWKIDKVSAKYFYAGFTSLCRKLIESHPSAFYSACTVAALQNRADEEKLNEVLEICQKYGYAWGTERIHTAAKEYPEELCDEIIQKFSSPIELPGLYGSFLKQALALPEEDRFTAWMTMLLALQRNYTVIQYERDVCSLRSMSASCDQTRKRVLRRLILEKSVYTDGYKLSPQECIDYGEYGAAIMAAEKLLKELPADSGATHFLTTLYNTYIALGRFMTEQSGSKRYKLRMLIDMATLLAQSKSYKDMDRLLDSCPAKWKLCLRSAQEFVQGNPQNVQYLLNKPSFYRHDGCYLHVYVMARNYFESKSEKWRNALQRENREEKRIREWTGFDLDSVPPPSANNKIFLIRSTTRNYAELRPYKEFVDEFIAQMDEDDRQNGISPEDLDANATEVIAFSGTQETVSSPEDTDLWDIPFVAESLERCQPDEQGDEEHPEADAKNKNGAKLRKDALMRALNGDCDNRTTIDVCSKQLVLMHQEPITDETKEYCLALGFALYQEMCRRNGLARYATEESRQILYSMAKLIKGRSSLQRFNVKLQVFVTECLESYENLSQLAADCMDDSLMLLCESVASENAEVSALLKNHVLFVREIGQKMRIPMTNADRMEWLQKCITECSTADHPVVKLPRQKLANMLIRELSAFRNKALIYLQVYNTESIADNACVFGNVKNLGGEAITRLVLSLTVNDVFMQQYSLPVLGSSEMVPFSLSCGDHDGETSLKYRIHLKYVTADGEEETAQSVAGTLSLKDPEKVAFRFQRYDASNPADIDNYVERKSINDTLEASYLVEGGFRRFPNFAIYGMKRSGKSSVLRRMGRLFEEHYPDTVHYAIVSCEGIAGDFYTRAHTVFVKYVLDELDFRFDLQSREGWQEFCSKWEKLPETVSDFRWLDSFYAALGRQWFPGAGLVILVDEIERLYFALEEEESFLTEEAENTAPESVASSNVQSMLWDVINKMSQRSGSQVRFVLCGSDFFTSKIVEEGDNLTQFFQKGVKLNVDRMEYSEIKEALCANHSVKLHDDAIDYLWDIANGLPWHSKIFCNSVIENQLIHQDSGKRKTIYPSDIRDAIDLILSTTKDIVSPANFGLLSLNEEEELVVRTMAEILDTRQASVSFDDLMERIGQVSKEEAQEKAYASALRNLVNERKLLKLEKGNYRFGCDLYRMYLRREHPVRFL